jgi:hypothetical protein
MLNKVSSNVQNNEYELDSPTKKLLDKYQIPSLPEIHED